MVEGHGTEEDIDTLLDVCDNILGRSFCALGDGAVSPIQSGIKYFREEFLALCEKNRHEQTKPELVGAQAS
jgi:NADH-quinone oxidoreductase subunit F